MHGTQHLIFLCLFFSLLSSIHTKNTLKCGSLKVDLSDMDFPIQRLVGDLIRKSRRQHTWRAERCAMLLTDTRYAHVAPRVYSTPVLRMLVVNNNVSETIETLLNSRMEDCGVVAMFMKNGRFLARVLKISERRRYISSKTNLILPEDKRFFTMSLNPIWRRLVNVVFVDLHTRVKGCYSLSTVSFPEPVDPDHPETWLPHQIDFWCDGRFKIKHPIFIDKTKDLQAFPLKIVYYKHIPTAVEVSSKIETAIPGIPLRGVEIELVALLAERMNFGILLEEITSNRSTGVVSAITNEHADIALGGFPHVPYYLRRLDLSEPYGLYCYTFLTPEALGDRSWLTLIIPFTQDLWLLSAAVLFLTWFSLFAIARLQEVKSDFGQPITCLLYTWSIQLLISIPFPPKGWPLRLLFLCAWVYCLILVVTYKASFASQLASPPPRYAVNSLEQLADAKHLDPITWTRHSRELLMASQDESSQSVGSRLRESDDTEIEVVSLVAAGKTAFLENEHLLRSLRQLWQHRNSGGNKLDGNYLLHIMEECVSTLPVSLGLERNSALTARVSRTLRTAVETGLSAKWLRDVTYASQHTEDILQASQQQQALVSLPKMVGAFVALAFGTGLALFILIIEVLYYKYCQYKINRDRLIKIKEQNVPINKFLKYNVV